jgi:hypothetical protein
VRPIKNPSASGGCGQRDRNFCGHRLTLNNLGALGDQRRVVDSRRNYEKALRIYRSLAGTNRDCGEPFVAITLNSLGARC